MNCMCIDMDTRNNDNEDSRFKKVRIKNSLIYVVFLFCMIAVLANKKNLHIDEVLTYGLANYVNGWIL